MAMLGRNAWRFIAASIAFAQACNATAATPTVLNLAPSGENAQPANPIEPKQLAIAAEVVARAYSPARMNSVIGRINNLRSTELMEFFHKKYQVNDDGFWVIVQDFSDKSTSNLRDYILSNIDQIKNVIIESYARQFSYKELVEIRDFLNTSAGKHYISTSDNILQDRDYWKLTNLISDFKKKVIPPINAEFEQNLRKYVQDHPNIKEQLAHKSQ